MTKAQYLEMCDALGTAPIEEEIPIEYDDFPPEIQQAFEVYYVLQDTWDTFGGNYLGKNLTAVKDIFDILSISTEEQPFILKMVSQIDRIRMKDISTRKEVEESLAKQEKPA